MKTITIQVPDGCEVQIVRKKDKKEPVIKTYQDLIDNKIKISGYWTSGDEINDWTLDFACNNSMDVAKSKKVTKSMIAMAMISQLMPYYGGEITNEEWKNGSSKYSIIRSGKAIDTSAYTAFYQFLSFHTREQRDEFLKNNEQLVKDYLMID